MPESADVAVTTVTFIFIITSIVGNSLVCAVIKRNRDMRIPIDFLLVNLAVADIIFCTFRIPGLILSYISTHPDGIAGKLLCQVRTETLGWIAAYSSIFSLLAIAFERYYAVIYPYEYKGKLTKRKLKMIIPGSWILSLIISTPHFLKTDFDMKLTTYQCHYEWPKQWMNTAYTWATNAFILLSIVLMAGLYARMVYTLWFKRDDDYTPTYQQQGVLKLRKRVTLMVLTVSAIFGICWGSDVIAHLLEDYGSYDLGSAAFPIVHTMIMFNSAVNPFAYALINHRFRKKLKGMICCSGSSPPAALEPQPKEMNDCSTQQNDTAGPSSKA